MPTPLLPEDPQGFALALVDALVAEQRGEQPSGPSSAELSGPIPPRVVTITAGRVAEILDEETALHLISSALYRLLTVIQRDDPRPPVAVLRILRRLADGLDPGEARDAIRAAGRAARMYRTLDLADEVQRHLEGEH